ncbi:MAG TPA: hypothetical protein PKU97_23820, partial [Kofleriaceae bacterium]|nr:hypothetical protein [Kofleriaceae bacterium]
AVDPVDYFAYQALERGRRRTPPGRKVFEQVIAARAGVEARIDLRPALAATGTGHVVARAVALGQAELDPVVAWIQVSGLAATTQVDGQRLQLWVQELGTGAPASPVAGAQTSLLTEAGASIAESPVVVTSAEGHAVHPLLAPDDRRGDTALLLARAGSDSTFLVLAGEVTAEAPGPVATWYVTDAHFLYKPKETVHVKGWLRWNPRGFDPRLLLPAAAERVAYTLEDVRGAEVAKGSVALSAHGGFAVSVPLPPTVALGRAMFTFEARGQTERHAIEIEDGRTAPFGVRLEAESEAGVEAPLDLQLGEAAELAVSAHYHAGGGMAGARVRWWTLLQPTSFAPRGWASFDFSRPVETGRKDNVVRSEFSRLSASSRSVAQVEVHALAGGSPAELVVEAEVRDVDRQTVRAAPRRFLVHPSAYYVGLREVQGDPGELEAVVTSIDGEVISGAPISIAVAPVKLGLARAALAQRCELVSAATPVRCRFVPPSSRWIASARVWT